jgi:hypothetical protein
MSDEENQLDVAALKCNNCEPVWSTFNDFMFFELNENVVSNKLNDDND